MADCDLSLSTISKVNLWVQTVLPFSPTCTFIRMRQTSYRDFSRKSKRSQPDPLFPIVNFPFICSNIPAAPAYGVYISQLIRYSRACGSYQDCSDRGLLLTRKLLNQGLLLVKLKSSLPKFYGRHHDLVNRYGISVSQMIKDMFHLS